MAAESVIRLTKEFRVSPSDLAELLVSLGGVKFWIVAIFPMYIGWVLAQPVGSRNLFVDDLRIVLAILVIGPFLGTFTLLLNVYYDMETTDRANPRKKYVQVVEELVGEGLMDRGTILLSAFGFAAIGLLLSWYISAALAGSGAFQVLMLLVFALAIAYSHPSVRLKGVAGLDLLTNMIGFGVLCPLAGWVLLQPVEAAPWWFIATIALFLGSLYAPTTASDRDADAAYGIRTLAVRLGVSRTLALGFLLLATSIAMLAVGWAQRWFPLHAEAHDAMALLWPFLALQLAFYAAFSIRPTVARVWALLFLLSLLQGIGVLLLLWRFVGERA